MWALLRTNSNLALRPSSAEAMADYGCIHLHLDSYPVSGTTTTLDSLAMGIPVLTCPTPYYAGAISAAILEVLALQTIFAATQHSCQLMPAGCGNHRSSARRVSAGASVTICDADAPRCLRQCRCCVRRAA